MLRQIVGQSHDAADLFYLLLPVRIPLHEGGGLPCQLGAGLGFVQALGQTLQQQSQGRGLLGGAAGLGFFRQEDSAGTELPKVLRNGFNGREGRAQPRAKRWGGVR